MGAQVIVTEIDPLKALEAVMDGFQVMSMADAAKIGDIFVTATGDINVLDKKHFEVMKHGAMLANSGHFNVEINIPALEKMSKGPAKQVRPFIQQFHLNDGRLINLLGEGRLINLSAAEGHPASVMDMSFANQALGAEFMAKNAGKLSKTVHQLPVEVDEEIARLKLEALGINIDKLTAEQDHYLNQWQQGT